MADRETLKLFVEAVAHEVSTNIADDGEAYAFFDATFRPEGTWRRGEIYLFAHHTDGISFFHAVNPASDGLNRWEREDVNGVKLVQELLATAASGGGYVESRWPDPTVEGDEEDGSPKLAYAVPVTVGGVPMLLGSGIYPVAPAR